MLTPEQLAGYREQANGIDAFAELLAHIDAQRSRIAELEAALAEWKSLRDPHVLHANLLRGIPAKLSDDQLLHIAGDKYQDMATRIAELEQDAARYRSICRDVASEWGNFAGGADECLRRIEAYEQSKETP